MLVGLMHDASRQGASVRVEAARDRIRLKMAMLKLGLPCANRRVLAVLRHLAA